MNFHFIEPEVAGDFGEGTILDARTHPPVVKNLNYRFQGWLGDALLECFPTLIATEDLAMAVLNAGLTGVEFSHVEVSKSDTFRELYPDRSLPKFKRMFITGRAGDDDFGVAELRLVVSGNALSVLTEFGIKNADVEEFVSAS